ncbi:hypothetical protein [uncultured Dokdonia sp.]|uniref:hypothetical protein n=1 Tax=uncultured Dokdonia sp. TaxID=575653 RepID=UPI0026056E63|nr:hypothetical protein [uncultured Dokdonia sp.]
MNTLRILFVFISFCAFAKAQNTSPAIAVNPVSYKLGIGEHQQINAVEITFLEVIEDSRCPKDVNCVWAGQAKIKVRVKEKGEESIEKEVIFDASGKSNTLYVSDKFVIKAVRLSPYPETSTAISNRVYYLELQV